MVKRSKGKLSSHTKKLRKTRKLTVNDKVKKFKVGQKVVIDVKPYFKGMPHPRYNGRHGVVVEIRKRACVVEIRDGKTKKQLVADPVHLKAA